MNKSIFFKISLIAVLIGGHTFSYFLQAQHLFSVNYNNLSNENVMFLNSQIVSFEISALTKNNENKEAYSVAFSSVTNTIIIILNEQTGAHVVITPEEESLTEFQLVPFFIEELKQATLGEANRYLVIETNLDFSIQSIASVSAAKRTIFIPQYFYGEKENIKEALPKDRQIIHIFKEKPRLIPIWDDQETLCQIAQLEETMSYYKYMFKLPDGVLATYDEHFNPDNEKNGSRVGENLEFALSGNLNAQQTTATEYALALWGAQLAGTIPVDINITTVQMGGGVLGSSYQQQHFLDPVTNTYYHSSLWNQIKGYDATNLRDIRLEMNSNSSIFYLGTNGNPGNRIDWVTVMLHEVCHGLGFSALTTEDGRYAYTNASGNGYYTNYPGIFDRQLYQGDTGNTALTTLDENNRYALLRSNNLYANAPASNLLAANGSTRVKMFAPTTYMRGSSVSHWDESVTFPTFMKYAIPYGLATHTFSSREIGIFLDMGWTQPMFDPNASWVTFHANGGVGNMSKQQFLPGQAQVLRTNAFTRTGHIFTNWNTVANGSGTAYENNQSIIISNDMNLHVQWQANTYTLTLNPNGGTVSPTTKQVTYGASVGTLPTPIRAGYVFQGWRIGSATITETTIWNYAQNMTATANWTTVGIVETLRATSLQIVPNPASYSIELRITNYTPDQIQEGIDQIDFYNIFGQLVKSVPFAGQTTMDGMLQKVDVSDLNAGIYMVKLGGKTVKLIVN